MVIDKLHTQHSRSFEDNKFVYPVLSRRAHGISLGINLNPDKICNFDCIYCQVNRRVDSETQFVECDRLLTELDATLRLVESGELYQCERFQQVPVPLRRLNDMAFSGDGEPTSFRNFDELIQRCADVKRAHRLDDVKMVLITNASLFHREHVQRGLAILDANQGEIWAKLDAGTEAYFREIDRTTIPFQRILDNIQQASLIRPLVIQSLFMKVAGEPPAAAEVEAYCDRLLEITHGGGQIQLVQVYTVARQPAESYVTPLTDTQVAAIAERVRDRTGLPVAAY